MSDSLATPSCVGPVEPEHDSACSTSDHRRTLYTPNRPNVWSDWVVKHDPARYPLAMPQLTASAAYPFNEPGNAITIHNGAIEVVGVGNANGQIWATMDGRLDINWKVQIDRTLELGDVTLCVQRPGIGRVNLSAFVSSSQGRGWINEASLKSGESLTRVAVHWVNLSSIWPAEVIRVRSPEGEINCWAVEAAGWHLSLASRQDIAETLNTLKRPSKFAITQVGELRRVDNSSFEADDAAHALFGLQMALSLALGRWVPPALPVGYAADGNRVWEHWAAWRCDSFAGYPSWWDDQNGNDLKDFVRVFMEAWFDPGRQDSLRHLAHHVIASNHMSTTPEARIMLAEAGMEYFSWVKYVIMGGRSRRAHKNSAQQHLGELLNAANIPAGIPAELPALEQFGAEEGVTDGPTLVTRVRNRLVHPKDAGEPYRIRNLVFEAWLLSMHYSELLLLHELGYRGRYRRRFPTNGWAHDRHAVPWASQP